MLVFSEIIHKNRTIRSKGNGTLRLFIHTAQLPSEILYHFIHLPEVHKSAYFT